MSSKSELAIEREKIATIDFQILQLISERLTIAQHLGTIKKNEGLSIRDYKVEQQVLTRCLKQAKELDISVNMTQKLVDLLLNEAIKVQEEKEIKESITNHIKKVLIIGGLGKMGKWMTGFFKSSGYMVDIVDVAGSKANSINSFLPGNLNTYDFIAICTPLDKIGSILTRITDLKPNGVIFDIGSLKSHIILELLQASKKGLKITSLHPMFGPNIRTLGGRNVILASCGSMEADTKVRNLFKETACNLMEIPVEDHDKYMSLSLGLSHAINLLFGMVLAKSGFNYQCLNNFSSTTFLKQARTAREVFTENPELYYSIQKFNTHKEKLYENLASSVENLKELILADSSVDFKNFVNECRIYFEI